MTETIEPEIQPIMLSEYGLLKEMESKVNRVVKARPENELKSRSLSLSLPPFYVFNSNRKWKMECEYSTFWYVVVPSQKTIMDTHFKN